MGKVIQSELPQVFQNLFRIALDKRS